MALADDCNRDSNIHSSPFQWEITNSIEMMNGTAALEVADIIV